MEKNEKQIIGVVQFNKEMEIIDKEGLENTLTLPNIPTQNVLIF